MKKIYLSLAVLSLCFASCKKEVKVEADSTTNDTIVKADESGAAAKPMDSAAVAEAWMAYATPGEMHKMMAAEEGKWKCVMTFWEHDGAKPQKMDMTADVKMTMDGRYQTGEYKGQMMGMDFEGMSTTAYNNATNEFESTWRDNMGTGLMMMKGKMNDDGKSMTLTGESVDPVTKNKCKMREVYTVVDDNTRKMEMFDTKGDEKEYKSMEIMMTRSK
ncbi:MAG: DUF1579 domain-containing protein [Flavobacterium sp.]